MAIDVTTLVDYSWSDIRIAAKAAMMQAAVSGVATYTINGRSLGRYSMKDLRALYDLADSMIADSAAESGNGIALVQYGERL
jgi:hypothetical protein